MKKIFTSIIICAFVPFLNAQEVHYGFKLGGNISNLVGDYPSINDSELSADHKSKLGIHLGMFFEHEINDRFSIQPELLLSTQGNKYEIIESYFDDISNSNEKITNTQTTRLTYLNLPIMLKYRLADKFFVEFGPQIGYLVSAKAEFEYEDANFPEDNESVTINLLQDGTVDFFGETATFKSTINRLDFGLNLGGSYDITEKIFVQARYYYGLSRIDKSSTNNLDFSSWNLKNSVFQLSVAYRLK
jgi:long-subunit fatty acid transport protein